MQCIGRISRVNGIRHFQDGKHRFYLEYRCTKLVSTSELCGKCSSRTNDKIQSSGKFDHGRMDQPIPVHSHMYGGPYYNAGCINYGPPSVEVIQEAEEYRRIASQGINVEPIDVEPIDVEPIGLPIVVEPIAKPNIKKMIRAPIIDDSESDVEPEPEPEPIKKKKVKAPVKPKAKPKPLAECNLVEPIITVYATHIEKDPEEVYLDDYEIEYITLSPFEYNDNQYLRDPIKNKIFELQRGGIGNYIGRYDSYTETILADIPDSDEE